MQHKLITHNCACGLPKLVRNIYIYIYTFVLRYNRLFIAVRLVNLYTHDVHSAPPAQKGDVQIFLVRKTVMIFVILKMNERADGNQKEKGFPREIFDFLLPSSHGRRHKRAGRR